MSTGGTSPSGSSGTAGGGATSGVAPCPTPRCPEGSLEVYGSDRCVQVDAGGCVPLSVPLLGNCGVAWYLECSSEPTLDAAVAADSGEDSGAGEQADAPGVTEVFVDGGGVE